MNFSDIKNWVIPEGTVTKVTDSLNRVIWEGVHDYSQDYFFIENRENSAATLTIKRSNLNAPAVTVYKSSDQTTWTSMGNTTTAGITATIPANDKLYLKASVNTWGNNYYNFISVDKNFNAGGNILSLIWGDNFSGQTNVRSYDYALRNLFYQASIVSAENLVLPSKTYNYCYLAMFAGSTLVTPPKLPATTLTINCYQNLFSNCRSLATPAEMLATTLANYSCSGMYQYCTSLTTSPVLRAKTLVQYCYNNMFSGCSSLNSITTYANTISASYCLAGWVNGVAQSGTFHNLGTATYTTGTGGIPSGWTEVNS